MSRTTPTNSAEQSPPPSPICGRRTVLRAVGLVALGGGTTAILAACSVDAGTSSPTTSSAPSQQTSPSAAASASPTTSASESPTSDESAAPEGTAVAISEVPVGGGVIVDEKYVVTQPTEGDFKVFSAICTHQQNPVGEVTDQQIVCNFHQSHFSITDGSVVSGPAQSALPAVEFVKSGDNIVITG
jgi:nitrite reductase/ring-hydroxylating ferredoxin subunit